MSRDRDNADDNLQKMLLGIILATVEMCAKVAESVPLNADGDPKEMRDRVTQAIRESASMHKVDLVTKWL